MSRERPRVGNECVCGGSGHLIGLGVFPPFSLFSVCVFQGVSEALILTIANAACFSLGDILFLAELSQRPNQLTHLS